MRYALYFSPDPDSAWWQAGCHWLGRDPSTTRDMAQLRIADVNPKVFHHLSRDARRYGFHATLKAPFRLAEGYDLAHLDRSLQAFCRQQKSIAVAPPQVEWLGPFLALRPSADGGELHHLAMQCVRDFDHLRAPLKPEELARRQQQQLSARQLRLLQHWGYPYTEEEYRFHMTLTDALDNTDAAAAIQHAAEQHFAIAEPLQIKDIALFAEQQPGADFALIRRYPLSA